MAMERRIGEIKVEKDGAISAVKTEFVQSAKQSGKDKVRYCINSKNIIKSICILANKVLELVVPLFIDSISLFLVFWIFFFVILYFVNK